MKKDKTPEPLRVEVVCPRDRDSEYGWPDPIGSHLVQYHPHSVGLTASLVDPAGSAELNQHSLCSNRDQSSAGVDQHMTALGLGAGDICDLRCAGSEALKYLLHFLGPYLK